MELTAIAKIRTCPIKPPKTPTFNYKLLLPNCEFVWFPSMSAMFWLKTFGRSSPFEASFSIIWSGLINSLRNTSYFVSSLYFFLSTLFSLFSFQFFLSFKFLLSFFLSNFISLSVQGVEVCFMDLKGCSGWVLNEKSEPIFDFFLQNDFVFDLSVEPG